MNKKDFKRFMRQGLGRCILTLQSSENIEKYKEIVLWGCLHNLSYDTQCEGTRAAYVYKLTTFFHDEEYFVSPTIKAFDNFSRREDWLFSHFSELLCKFAENGNDDAKKALEKKYNQPFSEILNNNDDPDYEIQRKPFEKPSVDDVKNQVASSGKLSPVLRIYFSKSANEVEKRNLAEAAIAEPDLEKKAELLSMFAFHGEKFPLSHEIMIEYSKSSHEKLCRVSLDVLANCQSQVVREYALQLLAEKKYKSYALEMLLCNYNPEDKELLLSELYKVKSDWHSIGLKILDVCDQNVNLPREFFIYIYETTLCSCCREYAVDALAKNHWLTQEIIEECQYDSNCDISEYVKSLKE